MKSLALIATTVAADGGRSLARADAAAVQLALAANSEAIALCPPGDDPAREYALAAGMNQALASEAWESRKTELAFVGTGFVERVGDLELARWAEALNATLLFDVLRLTMLGSEIGEVLCDAGRGARHQLRVRGPLVLVLSAQIARPAYVSRARRQVARRSQPSVGSTIAEPHVVNWQAVRPRVKARAIDATTSAGDRMDSAFSIAAESKAATSHVITADPQSCARHLLRYLAHHAFISATPISASQGHDFSADTPAQPPSSATIEPAKRENVTMTLGAAMERRPRQPQDSTARRARRPRPKAHSS